MADLAHLEKMGRELKCPICLSLLKSAVSLGCNHIFCNLCISESMRSVSNCPVCKIPFHRREIRAAPHMDNLVSIYKTMELASGVNIFTSQAAPPTKNQEKTTSEVDSKKNSDTSKVKVARGKSKEKGSSLKQRNKSENVDIKSLSKKRVHVMPYPVSETPVRPRKIPKSQLPSIEHRDEQVTDKNEMQATDEHIDPLFTPFFWLREENEDDETPEKLSSQQFDDAFTPNNPTCFSDIKDSDDNSTPIEVLPTTKTNVAEAFDSELFEWTQRACSPELCSTPLKTQTTKRHRLSGIQEKDDLTNSQHGIASNNEVLSVNANTEASRTGFERKSIAKIKKNSNCKGQRNHANTSLSRSSREAMDVLPETQMFLGEKFKEPNQESKDTAAKMPKNLGTKGGKANREPSRRNVKRLVKKPLSQFKVGLKMKCLQQSPTKHSRIQNQKERREGVGMDSPALLSLEKVNDIVSVVSTNTGNKSDVANVEHQRKNKRKKPSVPIAKAPEHPDNLVNNAEVQSEDCNEVYKNLEGPLGKQDGSGERSFVRRSRNNKIQSSGNLKKKRKNERVVDVAVARDAEKMPLKSLESIQGKNNHIGTNVQNSVCLAAVSSSVKNAFDTGDTILKRCTNIQSRILCAFCQSSDETEVSGEMMHYLGSKPVAADYNGGFNVIHSHKNCTEWAPDVYFEDDLAINLVAELVRSRRIKCSNCGIKGAALGCYEKGCRKSFHFTCAKLMPECRWDDDHFVMLCPLHSSLKLPSETGTPHKRQRKRSSLKVELHGTIGEPNQKWSWSFGSPYKWVLCCSALTAAEKEIVSKFTRLTSISISNTYIPTVSHVIASVDENGACKRTLKFLMGILDGKWILTIDWIKACMEAKEPVNEEKYEINLDTHGISGGPRLGRLRIDNKQPKLFNGFRFYFIGDFLPSYKGFLQDLVTAAGGTVLQRKPISRDQEKLLDEPSISATFIIYRLDVPENQRPSKETMTVDHRHAEAQYLADCCGAKVAGNSWIVDSIAACNLQPLA